MLKTVFVLTAVLLSFQSVHGADSVDTLKSTDNPTDNDHRQFVEMPDAARQLMRTDMLDHLSALNEIIGHLASKNLDTAAEVAESRMGKSSMGKHRASGMGPGRFMPLEMRNLGWGMHEAASEFAVAAKKGDINNAYAALQKVTSACTACHYSYRTR